MKVQHSYKPSVYESTGGHHATAKAGLGDTEQLDFPFLTGSSSTTSTAPVDWSKILSGLTSSFTSIYKSIQPIPEGCTQVISPGGVSSIQCLSPTQQALGINLNTMSSGLGVSSGMLLLLGVGFVAIMMLKR